MRPRHCEHVAVFFADLVGFKAYCQEKEPETVLDKLEVDDDAFEELTLEHGLEKIKTIDDAFMATSGLVRRSREPVLECVRRLDFVDRLASSNLPWQARVGIHVGATVNTVARLRATAMPER